MIVILPRTHLHTTRWGRKIFWDRRSGFLTLAPNGEWSRTTADQLQRYWPEAYQHWRLFARHLTTEEAHLAVGQFPRDTCAR